MSDLYIRSPRPPRLRRQPLAKPDRTEVKVLLLLAAPMAGASLVSMGMAITDTLMMGWIGPAAGGAISVRGRQG